MRCYGKYPHFASLVFFLISSCILLKGQTSEQALEKDSISSKYSLYGSAGYGSNLVYMGSTISGNLPYYSSSITLGYSGNLFLSASASHIPGESPFVAFYSLSSSYRYVVNSWLDFSADLSFFDTPGSLRSSLFNDFIFINFSSGFDWKLLYTKLSFSGLLSTENSGYIQIRNSHYFQTPPFFKEKAFLSFDPGINLLFGRLVKIETSGSTTKYGNAPPFVQLKKKQTGITYSYSYVFGMMDTEFSLPVTLNFDNFSFEAEAVYILPSYTNADYPAPKGFNFNLIAIFRFF